MEKYRDIMGRINYGLFLTAVFLLPFPQDLVRYACVAWIISWFLEFRWLRKPQLRNQTWLIFVAFGLWYGWKLISGFWAPDKAAWSWQMTRYLAFIFMVPVGIWGVNERYDWRQAGSTLVRGCLVALPFYLGLMTALYLHPQWVSFFSPAEWDFTHPTWWTYFNGNISAIKHRLFLCSIELFGAYIAFHVYRNRPWILVPAWMTMLFLILLTDSRQAVFMTIILAVIILLFALPKYIRARFCGIIIVMAVILAGMGLKMHPRMQQINMQTISEMNNITYDHEARLNIWAIALQQPEDYLPWGLGAGQSEIYLIDRYNEVGMDSYANMRFHAHSQYLEELMETGFVGLALLLLALIAMPAFANGKGRQTGVILITIFGLNMAVDCMFGLFCGIALWAVGMVFISLLSPPLRAA